MRITKSEMMRHVIFFIAVFVAAMMVYGPLSDLFHSRMYQNYHSLIPFIPLITAYLIYLNIKDIREKMHYSFGPGAAVIICGMVLYALGLGFGKTLNQNDYATVITFSSLVLLWGAFILVYGIKTFTATLFPLLFLIFTIPVPAFIMDRIIFFLQSGSTEMANFLFWVSQAPYYREGFVFHLPGMSVEVAPQCSGIRSALALFITALLAGYMFLNSWWRRIILVLCVFPITMFKNGIRIATLTLLGTYVDPRILQSDLHREGGIPFFILALLLMAPILYFLRKTEKKRGKGK
ncbi:MAG: exosortase/archaeosortase family protein [Syntrophus sp. (in: bacteria)]